MIEVRDLAAGYGDRPVLEGVSLSVADGEFLGLVGPNGSGKTTLLRAVNGLVVPEAGAVRVEGEAVEELSARAVARLVATVPQSTDLAFEFPVREIVAMGRTPHRSRFGSATPADVAAVERAMERAEVSALADRSSGELSGGERQRVLLARALAQETPALLLDEPTASLDINHQVRTLELVRSLTREGARTAVAAIHDLDLAARFCDRLALLADGELLAAGPPESVLTEPHLESAFGVRAAVSDDPVTGTPSVTPLSPPPDRDLAVHVLGGGRPAARTLARLRAAGFRPTAGVLPEGDVALETARALGLEAVVAAPFAPVDEAVLARAEELVAGAAVAVVAGRADDTVRRLARRGAAVVVVEGSVADADALAAALRECEVGAAGRARAVADGELRRVPDSAAAVGAVIDLGPSGAAG